MAITVYDPQALDNSAANSYVSRADVVAYAALRGLTFADAAGSDAFIIQAMDYLENQADNYKGEVTSFTQPLQWPRNDVWFNGASETEDMFPNTNIPQALKNAQCALACIVASGVSLYPATQGDKVKTEKVDVIETEYFPAGTAGGATADGTPLMPGVEALLAPLFDSDSKLALQVFRA